VFDDAAGLLYLMRACRSFVFSLACVVCCLPDAAAAGSAGADPVDLYETAWDASSPLAPHAHFLGHGPLAQEGPAGRPDGYDWRSVPPSPPDWRGVRRDTAYFLGYQFVAIAVLYVAPQSISGWSDEQKEDYDFERWRNNVSEPVWDEDTWWLNYLLHPYWGGAYYIRARERGLDRTQSFWFSALISAFYEYGAEALAEPVSAQDLLVTPLGGFVVGEYLFSPLRERIRAKPGKLDWSDKAILVATDPLGVINAGIDDFLGVESNLKWQPIGVQNPTYPPQAGHLDAVPAGLARGMAPAWGVQLRVDW
jgi:hypothetical protein